MDQGRFSAIAHARHQICSPISLHKARQVIDLLCLPDDALVVDYGCGKGEWLKLIAERYPIQGIGLERNQAMVIAAAQNCQDFPSISIQGQDARVFKLDAEVSLSMCIGSTGIFGGLHGALAHFGEALTKGNLLIIGEGFWEKEPHPDYLAATGIPRDEMGSFGAVVQFAQSHGFQEMYSVASSQDEWDDYEGLYLYNVIAFLKEHPDESDGPSMLERITNWRSSYLTWGRGTLGFGLFLFTKI